VGASIEGSRRALDALVEQFADTPTLLVLDNLEQAARYCLTSKGQSD
jgi:hypothetical protein